MCPLGFFYLYMDAVMKEVKRVMRKMRVRFSEEEREWRLPSLLYADKLVLFIEIEEGLKEMIGVLLRCGIEGA